MGGLPANLPSVVGSAEEWEQGMRDAQPAVDAEGATSLAPLRGISAMPRGRPLLPPLRRISAICRNAPVGLGIPRAATRHSPLAAMPCSAARPRRGRKGSVAPLGGLTDQSARAAARAARERLYLAGFRDGWGLACTWVRGATSESVEPERVERHMLWCGVCLTHHVPRPCELVASPSSPSSSSPSSAPTHYILSE